MACCALQPMALAARQARPTAAQQRAAAATPAAAQRRRQQRSRLPPPPRATEEQDQLDAQLQADLERMRQREAAAGGGSGAAPARGQQPAASSSSGGAESGGGLKEVVDKILIADFFFILFALAWLGVALGQRSATQSTALLDTWLSLWDVLFQPALGVLMLGALVSGAAGWARENLGSGKQ